MPFRPQNVRVVWSRAEDMGQGEERETFDMVTARAVAATRVLAELCLPLCKVGGVWVAPKQNLQVSSKEGGVDVGSGGLRQSTSEELEEARHAIDLLGGQVEGVEEVDSFGATGQRTAIVVRKAAATPGKYPRRAGVPNKKPL